MAVVNPKLLEILKSKEFKAKLATMLVKGDKFKNLLILQQVLRHELSISKS